MSSCSKCEKVRWFLSQFWTPDEIEEIFADEPVLTEKDIAEHNRRIEASAREPIALPREKEA